MIFGRLNEVLEGDKTLFEVLNENNTYINNTKKPSKISELLSKLSRYGISYDKDVYSNMHAIPANKDMIPKDYCDITNLYSGGISDTFRVKGDEEKPFNQKTLDQRRLVLRKMAEQPEIEDILDIMCNESIVYDSDNAYICQPYIDTSILQMLNEDNAEKIRNSVHTEFIKLYELLEWKTNAWDAYRKYLTDGALAYEIVYDDISNPHSIIGIVELDPATLTKKIENGKLYWYQYKGVQIKERKFIDAQIIYVKYQDSGVSSRSSYLEKLIRPFNIYRIIEQAQIIWTVTQSSFKTIFTIPVSGMNKAKGTQTLRAAMNRYKEDINFNAETGELKVNGRMNLPFNKEFWMPETAEGTPKIETLTDNGPNISDSEQLRLFLSRLYRTSKIPENRFDKENQSTWFGSDATQQLRDEINFSRFIKRMLNNFAQIMLKPLRIAVALSIPDVNTDKRLLGAISLSFNSYNPFEEMASIEIDNKRIEFISNMSNNLMITDAEGNEEPFFSMKFLIMKYLKMSDADLELNAKYKLEEKQSDINSEEDAVKDDEPEENNDLEKGDESDFDNQTKDEPEENNDLEKDESPEIDKEMRGDVKPE